jgi:aldose 1-epimerase
MKFLSVMLLAMSTIANAQTTVTQAPFGNLPDGRATTVFTLTSPQVTLKVATFGARVVSIETRDREGKLGEIVHGYSSVGGYVKDTHTYFGATPGRYANRIALGKFSLEGKSFELPINNPPNSLHGGAVGFDHRNWTAKQIANGVEFTLVSQDGDQGYPGTLTAHVRYELEGATIKLLYKATTDAPTVINLTNHTYFALGGDASPSILGEELTIDASHYTPIDATSIPLGPQAPVAGTPFDFRTPHTIGSRIDDVDVQLKNGAGYDHNFVLDGKPGTLHAAAQVYDPVSGRVLDVRTTEPGVQFYSGNFLDGTLPARDGGTYQKRSALCLETQHFPDSPNHPDYPTTELKPGQTYRSETTWTFSTR